MTTGIIVARIQCPYLHEGYIDLINHVSSQCDSIVLIIGKSEINLTDKHVFPVETRISIIREKYPFIKIVILDDNPSDEVWSRNLDDILHDLNNPILFGSRDSFIKCYTGNYPVKEYTPQIDISSTEIRKEIGKYDKTIISRDFRDGIIYAVENRYPIVYPTVDIAVLNGKGSFLLAKKKNHKQWCFVGGFIDTKDESIIYAAFRELNEEIENVKIIVPLEYIDSFKVDDWRYRGTKDSIMTSFFATVIKEDNIKASDDIEEIAWYNLENFDMELLQPCHHVLFNSLKKYLNA
jgi:bifunctional NMN adenylyltransferase/nudix hydrolase